MRIPLMGQRIRVGFRDHGTQAMYDNIGRGYQTPVTAAESASKATTTDETICADGGVRWTDLTGFRRDLLLQMYQMNAPHGLGIKDELEPHYSGSIHHGRLYPNLDALIDLGLVEKGEIDRRTNSYELTPAGRALVEEAAQTFATATEQPLVADGGRE